MSVSTPMRRTSSESCWACERVEPAARAADTAAYFQSLVCMVVSCLCSMRGVQLRPCVPKVQDHRKERAMQNPCPQGTRTYPESTSTEFWLKTADAETAREAFTKCATYQGNGKGAPDERCAPWGGQHAANAHGRAWPADAARAPVSGHLQFFGRAADDGFLRFQHRLLEFAQVVFFLGDFGKELLFLFGNLVIHILAEHDELGVVQVVFRAHLHELRDQVLGAGVLHFCLVEQVIEFFGVGIAQKGVEMLLFHF